MDSDHPTIRAKLDELHRVAGTPTLSAPLACRVEGQTVHLKCGYCFATTAVGIDEPGCVCEGCPCVLWNEARPR